LASGVLESPVITIAGEIDPFRVAKFVPHEIQVSLSSDSNSEETKDFMQRNPALNHRV